MQNIVLTNVLVKYWFCRHDRDRGHGNGDFQARKEDCGLRTVDSRQEIGYQELEPRL